MSGPQGRDGWLKTLAKLGGPSEEKAVKTGTFYLTVMARRTGEALPWPEGQGHNLHLA